MRLSAPNTYLLVGLAALAAVAGALVGQHRFDMQPCPWCVLQRLLFVAIGALGLLGWLARPRVIVQLAGALAGVAAAGGIAAALYQNLVAAKSASCNLTLADRIIGWTTLDRLLPEAFEVRASCADAAVQLLGVPFELWSAALYLMLGVAALWALRRS